MDCLFNWPRRPNAVLMGTKQVGTNAHILETHGAKHVGA